MTFCDTVLPYQMAPWLSSCTEESVLPRHLIAAPGDAAKEKLVARKLGVHGWKRWQYFRQCFSGTSVSRLTVCPLAETWDLFRQRVEKPPQRNLARIGVINIGHLAEIGRNFKDNPTTLTVEAVPLDGYPSHAEIPQQITRGLSYEIVKNLTLKEES
jgi:hypothetical protein